MFAIPARRGAMTRVERRNAVVTILTVVFLFCWLYVSRVGRLSTFASLFTMVVIEAVE
jgi:diacylglycerol kinase